MTILTDVCIHRDIVEALNAKGFAVIRASDAISPSAPDEKIFDFILRNKSILLTFDKDFGNILRFDIKSSCGVAIIYIEDMNKEEIVKSALDFFGKFNEAQLKGKLFIIQRDKVRIWHQ